MNLDLKLQSTKGTSLSELERLEAFTGFLLPESVKTFFLKNAGAVTHKDPNTLLVKIIHDDGWESNSFISKIESIETIMETWGYRGYLNEFQEDFELTEDYVEANFLFPIMEISSGAVYVAIGGKHNGKIYTVDNGDFGIIFHSNTLDEFVSKITITQDGDY